jgi:nucleotide-binding universal stress UspA family protein
MYHRIVVPLDGTPFSEHALPYAVRLAERAGANLELCHVHVHQDRNPDFAALTPYQFQHCVDAEYEFDAEAAEHEAEVLEAAAARVRAATSAVVTTRSLSGRVDGAIRQEAESAVADLVVMATHARSGFARVRLGSVADRLVHTLNIPVLLVQPGEAAEPPVFEGFRRVLIPLDGSPFSEQVIERSLPLLKAAGGTPVLLHVVAPMLGPARRPEAPAPEGRTIQRREDAVAYLEVQARTLAAEGLEPEIRVIVDRSPATAILSAAGEPDMDALVMATHGRGGVTRLLVGSVADQVLRQCRKPIMLYRPQPIGTARAELQDAFMIYGH